MCKKNLESTTWGTGYDTSTRIIQSTICAPSPVTFDVGNSTTIRSNLEVSILGEVWHLDPKEDMTAYELYNISVWKEEVKLNIHVPNYLENHFIDRITELGIIRHFRKDPKAGV